MNEEHFFNLEAIHDVYRDRFESLSFCIRNIKFNYGTLVPRYEMNLQNVEIHFSAIVTAVRLYRFTNAYQNLCGIFDYMDHNVLMFQHYGGTLLRFRDV